MRLAAHEMRQASRPKWGRLALLLPPACGEKVGMRGTLSRLRLADSPPHPDRKRDPTSPRKRGEVNGVCDSTQSDPASDVMIAPCEPKARLDLGDLGAAHRHAMGRWAIEFDHGAVAFLANQGDMRDRHDMAAVHPHEQAGIELRLGLRDRPRAHPLAGAVMDPGGMRVGPDAG